MPHAPLIALFGSLDSPQVAAVREAVLAEGGTPVVCNLRLGGPEAPLVTIDRDRLVWGGVDFRPVAAVYLRSNAPNTLPAVPPLMNAASYAEWRAPYLREQEYQAVSLSFFETLASRGKLVINPLHVGYIDHDTKGQFYARLHRHGFPVPRTLTTDRPEAAADFVDLLAQEGLEAVVKPAMGVGSTRVITGQDREHWQEIRRSPVMLQERIDGHTLRVHIVGDTVVLALRILSDGGVDSRTGTRQFTYVRLPEAEETRIVQANRMLGLHFAAWDIIESDQGGYVYLDCNPGPFVMWIGPRYVAAVFRQLAIYMMAFAQSGGSIAAASASVTPWRECG